MNEQTADVKGEKNEQESKTKEFAIDYAFTDRGTVVVIMDLDSNDLVIGQRDPRFSFVDIVKFQFKLLRDMLTGPIRIYHDAGSHWQDETVQKPADKYKLELATAPDRLLRNYAGKMERLIKQQSE